MPTINKRFLFQLVLVLAVVAGVIAGVHTIQAGRIPDALKRQAERAADANKPDAAVRYLRQYLEFRPNDVDVQEKLATLLRARSGDTARSELVFLYDKILRSDPARQAVRREAVVACLQLRRNTDAATHAEAYLKDAPTDATVWRYLARAQVGQRQFPEARKSFEKAIEVAPTELAGYQLLGEFLWLDLEKAADAKPVYDRMVAALPTNAEAYLARAKFLIRSAEAAAAIPAAKDDPALADLSTALTLAPENAEAAVLKGERLQRHRDAIAARGAFLDGLKHHPDDENLLRSLAWLEVHRGNLPGAIQVLEDAVEKAKDGMNIIVPLADLLLQSGDGSRTDEIITKLERRRGKNVKARADYLRGRLAMHRQKWSDAVAVFTALRAEAVELPALETQANLLLAGCHEQLGDLAKAIECYQLVTMKEPGNLTARVALAQAHLAAGQSAEAAKEYEQAAANPAATPRVMDAFVQLKALRLAAANASDEAWRELEKTVLDLANRLGPKTADGGLLVGDFARTAGKPKVALDVLQKTVTRHPNDGRAWVKFAEVVADTNGVAAGLRVLDEAQGLLGDTADLRLARAELYARDPARLRPLTNLETQTDAWSEDEQTRLLYGLIDLNDRVGDAAAVIHLYKKVAARRPRDAAVWLTLCDRGWAAGDAATAKEAAAMLANLDAKPAEAAALCAAWQELAGGAKGEAAKATFGDKPTRADACVVLARQFDRDKQPDRAGELFGRAVRLGYLEYEPAKAYLAHLATRGTDADLQRYVVQLATDPRWAGEPFLRAVRGATLAVKDADRLLAACRRHVERLPGGTGWLADLYTSLGRTREALALCERVVATPTATADDWLRYALRKAEAGGRDAGVTVVMAAKPRLSPPAFAALAVAFTESRVGQGAVISVAPRAFADARLSILLAQLDREKAVRMLEAFLKEKADAKADTTWGRRKLAMLLTVRGEPADRKRAFELLAEDAGDTADEKRTTAAVLASLYRFLDGPDRAAVVTKATDLLEDLTATAAKNPRDSLALGQLYQAAGRTADAVQVVQKLLNENPDNVEFLLAALTILADSNKRDAAKPFADRLLAVAPTDYRSLAAVARYACEGGDADRAVQLAERYERTADPTVGDQNYKTMRAAELLDQLARLPGVAKTPNAAKLVDVAVAKYESILHARPEQLTAVAAALAADGRLPQAFAAIDKHDKVVPIRFVALAGVAAFRAGGVLDAQKPNVRTWLDAAVAKEPASVQLRLAEAEYLTLVNDLPAAERAYEAVLKQDPRNLVALNNLAWILAPRADAADRAKTLLDRAAKESGLTAELLDTRARIHIAAEKYALAERDAAEALKQDKTPLRYFHLALAQRGQEPGKGKSTYQEAKKRGLDAKAVHPLDRPVLAQFERGQ
jgi:tetratricopeptide (TPR) repeat protein